MTAHPMLPGTTHDEAAAQLFVRDFKMFLTDALEPGLRAQAEALDPGAGSNARVETVYERLHEDEDFRNWASLRRRSQEMLWDSVSESVQRQAEALEALAAAAPQTGSLTLDPAFVQPDYLETGDVHLMPGGYAHDDGGVLQGAVMDRGGAVYMLGRNGGLMNDVRGHTVVGHLFTQYPDLEPLRILELGCGVGASLLPMAEAFPHAEVHGIDVGAAMLRYTLARARHLGQTVHLSQGSAECAPYPDASFDLVFSSVLLHETSPDAIGRIMAESHRLLRSGGVAIHLEVPNRYDALDLWGKVRGEIEADYNNEPNWKAAISADYRTLLAQAGFAEIAVGYQSATSAPTRDAGGFSDRSEGTFRSWFVASARK